MSRFYVRPEDKRGDEIFVGGGEAHHILDVMRLKPGDPVTAFDGTGNEYKGVIRRSDKKSLVIKIEGSSASSPAKGYNVTLAQAIPKKEMGRMVMISALKYMLTNRPRELGSLA